MFTLSLPVQRFVIGCIVLIVLILTMNTLLDDFWTWTNHAIDVIQSQGQK